ncbi:MAG: hypothetical protein EPN25_04880 [Nitrospirae bacterium]|nr:MAG: hypothetical protein EPN25_04880 [Nitrospirota bacterium]
MMPKTILRSAVISLLVLGSLPVETKAQSYDSLKAALSNPKKATVVTLKDDPRLKQLPPEIKKLRNLQRLQIGCLPQLEALPAEIGSLPKLERLIIDNGSGCKMNIAIPESIGNLSNLRVLRLSGVTDNAAADTSKQTLKKQAKHLPKGISRLKNLTELDLGRNGLTEVPQQIAGLDKLERLLLDDNSIPEIPAFVAKLKKLKELSVISANVPSFPDDFKTVKGLRVILGGSNITSADLEMLKKNFPNLKFDLAGKQAEPPVKTARSPEKKKSSAGSPNYRAIFTNGLDENNEPINNLRELTLEEKSIYLYVMWYSLPRETHQYLCNIYDGSGDLVKQTKMDFSPSDDTHYTYTAYQIRKNLDSPGQWKFEIFLDGVRVIDKQITVAAR